MTRLYIAGGPGSGKTTYARYLSHRLGIPCLDLDTLKWERQGDSVVFNRKRDRNERVTLLHRFLSENPNWICEGVYFQDWIIPLLERADRVIVLKPNVWVRQFRIIRRSFRRRFGREPAKYHETLGALYRLLQWSQVYDTRYLPQLLDKARRVGCPYRILTGTDEADR